MATHPSILAWRIPWTEEPGGLQSMGSQRVRQLTDRQTYTHRVHGVTESWIANTHTHTHTHTHFKRKSWKPKHHSEKYWGDLN